MSGRGAGKRRTGTGAEEEDEDIAASYRWEQGGGDSWEHVKEDAEGNIIAVSNDRERSNRAKQQRVTQSIRRGLIRYLVIAIDCSASAADKDMRPCRLEAAKTCVKRFIREYFDQNPISQLSICITRDRVAERITELSGNPKNHEQKLDTLMNTKGAASLQNVLTLSITILKQIPDYGHRELLIVYSSLSTCDPGDHGGIFTVIEEAIKCKIRISVICLAAELYICRYMAEKTNGTFAVASDAAHLTELLQAHTVPPPELKHKGNMTTDFVYMGFPKRTFDGSASYGFDGNAIQLFSTAYICPRCYNRTSEIPTQCCVCKVQLNSSSHIARSHHHLFPVPNFDELSVTLSKDKKTLRAYKMLLSEPEKELGIRKNYTVSSTVNETSVKEEVVQIENKVENGVKCEVEAYSNQNTDVDFVGVLSSCKGCLEMFSKVSLVMQCPLCENMFCIECDLFIHNSLHNCPGCVV